MPSARSLWFAAPRQVEIRSHELPPIADGQVLVRTSFSGISAGTELLAFRGELDPELPVDETIGALGGTFRYPFRYGYSCVGVVDESRRDAVPAGTTVFAFHPHQDRVRRRRRRSGRPRLGAECGGRRCSRSSRPRYRSASTPVRCWARPCASSDSAQSVR